MTRVVLLVLLHYFLCLVDHVQEALEVLIDRLLHTQNGEPLIAIASTQAVNQLVQNRLDCYFTLILDHVYLLLIEFALVLCHDCVQRSVNLRINHLAAHVFYYLIVYEFAVGVGHSLRRLDLTCHLAGEPSRSCPYVLLDLIHFIVARVIHGMHSLHFLDGFEASGLEVVPRLRRLPLEHIHLILLNVHMVLVVGDVLVLRHWTWATVVQANAAVFQLLGLELSQKFDEKECDL